MTTRNEIETLYAQYLEQAVNAEQNRRLTDGMFGFGKKPADDPCHTQFIEALQQILQEYAQNEPDAAELREILAWIFRMPTEHREPKSAYWMLLAAHGTVRGLIPKLKPDDAVALTKEYAKLYRKWERLPVQDEIYKALQKAANT